MGENLDLRESKIKSLGDLEFVGGNLFLSNTPLSKKYTEKQIRKMVYVQRGVYF